MNVEMLEFNSILARIAKGEDVKPAELIPFLCLESMELRSSVNANLAHTYYKLRPPEYLQQAKVFIQRAWVLSGFDERLLPLYRDVYAALGDTGAIREAYKRLIFKAAAAGDITGVSRYFDLWQYAYPKHEGIDRYEFDFDVMECIRGLAEPYSFSPSFYPDAPYGRKIRLAYLMKGITELNSVLVKLNLLYAEHHDKSRFEITFYVPETAQAILESRYGSECIRLIESHGCRLVSAPDNENIIQRLVALAGKIYDSKADMLIVSAALADFSHYFLTSLRPAQVVVGFVYGPPPQFSPPGLDWAISMTKHPLMDSPLGCSMVDLEVELPERDQIGEHSRSELGVPEDACILLTAGRSPKFQSKEFWNVVLEVLSSHEGVYYIAVGVLESQLSFSGCPLWQEMKSRVRFFGWTDNYLKIISQADIFLDTYPSGGGVVLLDAMALGIPVVSFENDYMKIYDQTDWNPAEEYVPVPDLIVSRGDFSGMKDILSRLIDDKKYRRNAGRVCEKHIRLTRGDPKRMVQSCEKIYLKVFKEKQEEASSHVKRTKDSGVFALMKTANAGLAPGMVDEDNPDYHNLWIWLSSNPQSINMLEWLMRTPNLVYLLGWLKRTPVIFKPLLSLLNMAVKIKESMPVKLADSFKKRSQDL